MLDNNRGSALVLVVMISTILLTLGVGLNFYMLGESSQSNLQYRKTQAYYIARSGAAAAADWIINMDDNQVSQFRKLSFPIESEDKEFGNGKFKVLIDQDGRHVYIDSRGTVANGKERDVEETVTIVLNKEVIIPTIDMAIFSEGEVSLGGRIVGGVATNSKDEGAIEFTNEYRIYSRDPSERTTVFIQDDGSSHEELISTPEGWIYSLGKDIGLDHIGKRNYPMPKLPKFPENLPDGGSIINNATIEQDGFFESVSVSTPEHILTIDARQGDRIIRIGSLNIFNGKIQVIGEGEVSIFVDRVQRLKGYIECDNPESVVLYCAETDFKIGGDSRINTSLYLGDAEVTIGNGSVINGDIITTGGSITVEGDVSVGGGLDSHIRGVIYAPASNILIKNSAKVYGAVIGLQVTLTGDPLIEYDTSVSLKVPIDTDDINSSTYEMGHWQ